MEKSHLTKFYTVNINKIFVLQTPFRPDKLFFYILTVAALLWIHIPAYAINDTNEPEPNTIPELFEKSAIYPQQEMVNRTIQILEKESVEESLDKLSEYLLFMWPGEVQTYELQYKVEIPLSGSIGKREIMSISGNRRFLKVTDELSKLPKEQAAELVNKEIIFSLQEYNQLFDSFLKMHALPEENQNNKVKRQGMSFAGFTPDGKPTLKAIRYKVLASVLIAGNLQLKQSQPAIEKILETAIKQRNKFYDKDMWDISISFPVLAFASLYNRQILATGVLGTSIEAEKGNEILKDKGCKMAGERLTKFDSPVAVYDLTRLQEGKATDYSKGELNIKYLSPLDDSAFDNLINAIKAEQAAAPADANSV